VFSHSKMIYHAVADMMSCSKVIYDFKLFDTIYSRKKLFSEILCDLRSFSVVRGIS